MSHQFNCLLDNLLLGLVLFVNDYAQNILYVSRKSLLQFTGYIIKLRYNPSVVYFLCPGCGQVIIKEEIYHITSDTKHNWRGIDHFMRLNLNHLHSKGVKIERIHDFTDNAGSQYRSRFIWNHLSRFAYRGQGIILPLIMAKQLQIEHLIFSKSFVRDNISS